MHCRWYCTIIYLSVVCPAPQFNVLTDIAQYTCWHFFLIRLFYTITSNRDLVIVARVIKNLPLLL